MQGQRTDCLHFVSPETGEYFGSGRLPILLMGHWLQVTTGFVPLPLLVQAMAAFLLLANNASGRFRLYRQSLRAALAGGVCEIGVMAVLLFPLTLSRRSRRQGLHALRAFAAGPANAP
ncbi:hypothetical protein D9M69_320140 [compost metagenome]